MTDIQLCGLLDAIPLPVVFTQDGAVRCLNAAAAGLFPGLAPGGAPPDCLDGCRPGTAVTAALGGTMYLITALPAEGGTLLTLNPQPQLHVPPAVLAGQLRQRLSVAMSAAQVIAPALENAGHMQDYLAALNKGLYQILRVVRNLEQTDGETVPFRPSTVDLVELCAFLYEQCASLCAEAGVTLRYECKLPALVTTGDLEKLTHIITALLSNAARAAGQGGQVLLRLTEKSGRAILTVWDNGAGLTEADLAAYWSGGTDQPGPRPGLGLGLPLVRHFAHLHGGAVMVETGTGNGLTATVSLPIDPPPAGIGRARPNRFEGLSELLIEFSDVLPARAFAPKNLE